MHSGCGPPCPGIFLRSLLQRFGFRVQTVSDGLQAEEKAVLNFDLIFMDCPMPVVGAGRTKSLHLFPGPFPPRGLPAIGPCANLHPIFPPAFRALILDPFKKRKIGPAASGARADSVA